MLAPDGARALERVLLQLEPELERRGLKRAEVRQRDVVVLAVEESSEALPLALLGRRKILAPVGVVNLAMLSD